MNKVIRFFSSSIRVRILSIFSVVGLLISILVIAGYYQLNQVIRSSERIEPHSIQIGLLQDFALSVSSLDANLERFLVIGGAEFKEDVVQDLDDISVAIQAIKRQADSEIKAPLEELDEVISNLQLDISNLLLLKESPADLNAQEVNDKIIIVYSQIDTLKQLHQSLSTITQSHMQGMIAVQNGLISNVLNKFIFLGILMVTAVLAVAVVITRILNPIGSLTDSIQAIESGDLNRTVLVESHDEIGILAQSFNKMTGQIRDLIGNLEKRVVERTHALEISLEVSWRLSKILDREQLVSAVVEEVRTAFNYYYTHIYLFDEDRQNLVLVGGSGTIGQATIAQDHKIPRGKGLVGRAADTNFRVLEPDVSQAQGWIPHPLLPDVKAEIEVPIAAGDRVLGVLGVQHNVLNGLTQEDADLLQSIANQVAVALENARLYEQAQREINERQRAELTLQSYVDKLEASNRELEEFAYIASHDLQEPLRKVQAFGSRLQGKYGDTLGDRGSDYLVRMLNATERMQTLINGLLDYSRVMAKSRPFEPVDLNQVARAVISDLEIRIEETGGRVIFGELPTIEADPLQIRQLLQNLMGNALKFSRPDIAPEIYIQSQSLNGNSAQNGDATNLCQISVTDNGIGFDEKYADRIFGIFQRLHGFGKYEGTGIGLAVCKKIVERHEGSLTVESTLGEGATFIITLPITHSNGGIKENEQ